MGNRQLKLSKGFMSKNQDAGQTASPSNGTSTAAAAGGGGFKSRVVRRDTTEHVEILLKKGPITDYYDVDKNSVLGKGHYATVYRGRDKKSGLQVAVKVIQISKSRVEALKREVEVLRKVGKHPNIVTLYDIFITESELILVLELLLGGELFDRMVEKGPYSEREASHHIRKIGAALKFLHRGGIVHRDLKPENLILAHKGDNSELKIADFGLANIVDNTESATMKTVCGTWAYCAPEVKTSMTEEGGHACYTAKVDLWSVGVILFVVLAAYHPFDADGDASDAQLWSNICSGEFDFNDPAWDHISSGAKDLIKNLIVVDPAKRFGTDELLAHPWVGQAASVPATPITPNINRSLIDYNDRRKSRKSFGAKIKWMNPLAGGNNNSNNNQQNYQHQQQANGAAAAAAALAYPSSAATTPATTPTGPTELGQPITQEDVRAQQRILHEEQLSQAQEKLKAMHLEEQQQLKVHQHQQQSLLQQQLQGEQQRLVQYFQQLQQKASQAGGVLSDEDRNQKLAILQQQQQLQQQAHDQEQQLLGLFHQQQEQLLQRQAQQGEQLKAQYSAALEQLQQTHQQKQPRPTSVRFAEQVQPMIETGMPREPSPTPEDGDMEDDTAAQQPDVSLPQLTLNTLLPTGIDVNAMSD